MTIYGYLRVSSDDQDVNNQKSGVENFAAEHKWIIDEFITDEGVSGGKDPDKRNLGPLLKKVQKGDIIIASEISRLGRDLYMVMDILHYCMEQGCVIHTVKDRFTLGDDIQSKVLAFAFGLAAEIERQMIRQRTLEALRLRVKYGVLLGRPIGAKTSYDTKQKKMYLEQKADIWNALNYGAPLRSIAPKLGISRATLYRFLIEDGYYLSIGVEPPDMNKKFRAPKMANYKDEPYQLVELPRATVIEAIEKDLTIPEIQKLLKVFTYEQVYDTILVNKEYNTLYRQHGHKIAMRLFGSRNKK